MSDTVAKLQNGWSIKAVNQLQKQRNDAMDMMELGLDLVSKAIERAPSLSFEGVLANHYWYCNGRFAQLKEDLDHALDKRCLEILEEIHPNAEELRAQALRQHTKLLQTIKEAPLQLDVKRRELVLALRYFQSVPRVDQCFKVNLTLHAKNCFEHGHWADYSRAGETLRNLWSALLAFDRLLWSNAKPTLGAARFMDPMLVVADGLHQGRVNYDFLLFTLRVDGQDMLLDFSDRPELVAHINAEIETYYSR